MSCYITITNITGEPPYTITVCDNSGNNCFEAAYELSYVPPTIYVDIPSDWSTLPFIQVTVQSSEGCEQLQFVNTTPTPTPTPTPTMPAASLTMTPTLTSTPTPTPSTVAPIPPYFEVQNIVGVNPMSVSFILSSVSSLDYTWGDGSGTNTFTKSTGGATGYTFNKSYGASTYTAKFDNFKSGTTISTNKVTEIDLFNISDIIENQYTFSGFSATTVIKLSSTTLTDFSSSLPNSLLDFYVYSTYAPSSQNFQFSPTSDLATLPNFRILLIRDTDMTGFTHNLSGSSTFRTLQLQSNNSLTDLNFTAPTGSTYRDFFVINNTSLPSINVTNYLSGCTGLKNIDVYGNSSLTGWTYTIPSVAEELLLNSNNISNFDIDLNPNVNLQTLRLDSNIVLSSFTNTVSACTSLVTLRMDRNNLSVMPPIFPNSIQTLRLDLNNFTGYTSNFPTSCVYFDMSDVGPLQYVPQWSVELTGSTLLNTFLLNSVSLSGWTTQFPPSIKTITMNDNLMTNFDFNYTLGATTIELDNNSLTGLTNLSAHTSIVTLDLGSNDFINSDQIIQGNFPTTLRTLKVDGNLNLTGWTSTLSAMTNMLSLDFRNTNLKTAAVDYILQDVAATATANTLYNKTLYLSGTAVTQPQSPTGGLANPYYLLLKNSPYSWTITVKP